MARNSQLLASLYRGLSEVINLLDSGSVLFASSLIVTLLTRSSKLPPLPPPVEGCQEQSGPQPLEETKALDEVEGQLRTLLVQTLGVHPSVGGHLFFGRCGAGDIGEDDSTGLEDSWRSLAGWVAGISSRTAHRHQSSSDIPQNSLHVRVVNQLTSALLVCRVAAGGGLVFSHLLQPSSSSSALLCSPDIGNTFVCMKAFMDSKSLYDNDCHDIERVVTPLPTSLLDVKPENLVCLFQSPLEDTTTSCTFIVTFQRCVVLGDNEMEERRAQVIMERQWSNGNAHCTVITRFSDDDLYSSLEQSSQCSVDSKSSSIPTMPSPPSLKTPDGGATVGPGGTCAFRLPVTPETARKEEPQHPAYRTTVGGDDVIAVEHRNDQGQLRSASSPISPLLSFNTLPEFCPPAQSVASVSSEHMLPPDQEDSRHIPDYLNWDQEQELEENQLVQASPCVSPTLAVRISPITSEEMEQCVDERVQENTFEIGETGELCDRDEEASLTVEASSLQTYPLVTSETLTEEQLEEQELHRHEEKDNGQGLERYEFEGAVDETQTIMTSPRLNSPPARVHCQSRPNTVPSSSSFATAKPQNLSPSPTQSPRVSGVFDNLLWAVLTLTSTTSTDGVDNQIGDVDSSTSSVGSRSRSSSYNSLAELNVHVSDPGTAAES